MNRKKKKKKVTKMKTATHLLTPYNKQIAHHTFKIYRRRKPSNRQRMNRISLG